MSRRNIILRLTVFSALCCLVIQALHCQSSELVSYKVELPGTILPMPYHSEKGIEPGFEIRGIKGYAWTPEQYLSEIPTLVAGKANFLMNCYLSMFSPKEKPVYKYGTFLDSIENDWWNPLPVDRKNEWIKVIKSCGENNIDFCFSMNPQLFSARPLKTNSDEDFNLLWKHYEWAQQNAVKWFSLCLDDVDERMVEVEGRNHALLANRLFEALKANDKDASFAFCPTWYWGTGSDPRHRVYLEALAGTLDPEIYVFWTGPYIVPVKITTAEALEFGNIIKHRIILWDNYPVNDNHPAIHLGPLTGRDKDLCEVVDGYMSNSMGLQNDINRIPLLTALDYAYNPEEYDPSRSIGQAIVHLTSDPSEQRSLSKLVEAYPGSLILTADKSAKGNVSLNPVRDSFMNLLTSEANVRSVEDYICTYELLLKELRGSFPDTYKEGISFLKNEIRWMREQQNNFGDATSKNVHRSLSLQSSRDNPGNSEGDFIILEPVLNGQEQLTAIDSLYMASIDHFYKNAENAKSKIWTGMELAPVCLFRVNGPAILYNHPNPPENFIKVTDKLYIGKQNDLQLFGATQMEINGTLTAIVDYGSIHYSCIEEVYAELFHELHHVYQRFFINQIRFDNPDILLTYPENYINDAIKLFEQKTLYKMCFEQDSISFQKLLNKFYSCRLKREQTIGDFLRYEETVENMEGPAFYCEYKFYNHFASCNEELKDNYNQKYFFGILTTPFYGRESLRYRHLSAGMAMCFILNKHIDNWQSEYYSEGLSLYDFFIHKFKPQKEELEINSWYYDVSKFHTHKQILEHQVSFDKFNTQKGIKIILKFNKNPQFNGFDPMHAESINDSTILHKTLLRLSGGENDKLFVTNKNAVTIIDEEIWFVKKVILFAPEESILIKNNRIVVDVEGENIFWTGKLIMKTENEIIFNCE